MLRDPSLSEITKLARARALASWRCAKCGGEQFEHLTNGDGACLAICVGCGTALPVGRWYQDGDVGVRVPALSTWSSVRTG